jgi:small subunit ribosomal protein S17
MENNSNNNKITAKKKGKVVSSHGDKTIVVSIESYKTHPKYKKKYRSTKKYKAHDQENKHNVGDTVEIVSCKPISKDKKYRVI